ncbi:hypothetical protein [Streptomyces sp. C10-9-1]|uniref:hypothetical protein n=1 Tax=Streptomyces sp. C10-9-1 TaxID=1859285 RepID=UPI003D7413C2
MTRQRTQHWTDSLFDSVYALYEAAREYRTAHQAALVAQESVDLDRRRIHEGETEAVRRLHGRGDTHTRRHVPHQQAVFALHREYGDLVSRMHRSYLDAALLYATGTVWAIRTVQDGGTPPVVAFERDGDGTLLHRPVLLPELDRYSEQAALQRTYDRLAYCIDADRYSEDLAGADYVTDHEAGEMFAAAAAAQGMADAAYAYGLAAQKALSYTLLGPRAERAKQRSAARTATATDTPA